MYYGYFIYQFVLLPKPPFILNILRASERAASHYTPVLYFLSLNLYYQQTRMIGQPSSFLHFHIPLAAAATAAVLIWRLCFGRRGCHVVLICVSLRVMAAIVFCKSVDTAL